MSLAKSISNAFNTIFSKDIDKKMSKLGTATVHYEVKEGNPVFKPDIQILDIAPNVYLSCRAAKVCVNRKVSGTIDDRLKYVSNIVKLGHESVIEHTNIISVISFSKDEYTINEDFLEILSNMKFLNTAIRIADNRVNILIGGSIRGYLHTVRETVQDNTVLNSIKEIIYRSVEKSYLIPLIEEGLLDEDKCTYLPSAEIGLERSSMTQFRDKKEANSPKTKINDNYDSVVVSEDINPKEIEGDTSDLIYKTDIDYVYQQAIAYGFTKRDVYKVSTISLVFHDISRSCGNQLCRHRNAISQESQRYVTGEYQTDKDFINPINMQLDSRYKDFSKEVIDKANSIDVFKDYKYLIASSVIKEDARAWLPMNVKTKLMMTFTYWNFAKFLSLRLDKAAQLEIRLMAKEAADKVFDKEEDISDFINTCTDYGYKDYTSEFNNIDDEVDEENNLLKVDTIDEADKLIKINEKYKRLED